MTRGAMAVVRTAGSMAIKLEVGLAALTEDNEALLEIDALDDILRMVSSSPEHLAGCLRVLACKLGSEQTLCCLKALLLVHIWLRDADFTVHKSSLLGLGSYLSQISSVNPFLRMYAIYIQDCLETYLWPPQETNLDAFIKNFASMDQRIEKLAQCWPGVLDAEPMVMAVDLLMHDAFRWYVYLRSCIDELLSATKGGDFSLAQFLDASFRCTRRLLQFSGVAYSCTLQRESKAIGLLSQLVTEDTENVISGRLDVDTIIENVENLASGKLNVAVVESLLVNKELSVQERQGVVAEEEGRGVAEELHGSSINKGRGVAEELHGSSINKGRGVMKGWVQGHAQNVSSIASVRQGVGEELNDASVNKGKGVLEGQVQEHGENASSIASVLELLQGISSGQQKIHTDLGGLSTDVKGLKSESTQQKNALEQQKNALEVMSKESKAFRKEIRRKLDTNGQQSSKHMEALGRHIGAYHEKLSRALLGRNVQDLLPICKELKIFLHFNSRRSVTFFSLEEICAHLRLSVQELCTAKSFLVQELKKEPIAKAVLTSFLKGFLSELHNFHGSKKEQWSSNNRKVELFGSEVMDMMKEAHFNAAEIIQRLNIMKDSLNCGQSNKLKMFQDSLDHVTSLFSISEVTRHVTRVHEIMKERWGLLVVFYLLTQKFRHPSLELDVCGSVERFRNAWHVGYGEIKTSDKAGLQKGIQQLKFTADVFGFLLNAAGGNKRFVLDATKCLFIVHNAQDDVIPLIQEVEGIVQVNVSQLPY